MKAIAYLFLHLVDYNSKLGLFTRIYECAVDNLPMDDTAIADAVNGFGKALDEFGESMRQDRKYLETKGVKDADNRVKNIYSGFCLALRALMQHPNVEKRTLVKDVAAIFNQHGFATEIARRSAYERYGAIDQVLDELSMVKAETLAVLGLDEWYEALKSAAGEYYELSESLAVRKGDYRKGWCLRSRIAVDDAYRRLVNTVNALATVHGAELYDDFVSPVNVMIRQANANVKSRRTRNSGEKK